MANAMFAEMLENNPNFMQLIPEANTLNCTKVTCTHK
jgi:hypothetical protein